MTQEKLLDKLAKMKRMADGAKAIGSEAEAQAFAEALQRMLLDHKLSMSDLDFETMEKDSPVFTHYIDYDKYPGVRVKKVRVGWIEDLANMVARAHFCRILIHPGSSRITLVGKAEDSVLAEYVFMTLQLAAEKISGRAYDQYRNEERRKQIEKLGEAGLHGSLPHTFGFRESFISAFIERLRERFREMKEQAVASTSTALVRLDRTEAAVNEYMKQYKGKAAPVKKSNSYHREGELRGKAAANNVNLTAAKEAVLGTSKQIQKALR